MIVILDRNLQVVWAWTFVLGGKIATAKCPFPGCLLFLAVVTAPELSNRPGNLSSRAATGLADLID
jgi:hypothetical protein